jgi:hypothetical protein
MLPDRDLDRELRDLGSRLQYPPVPDLVRSVRDRLETEDRTSGSSRSRSRPQLWWIAAAALILIVGVPVFSLAMRDMVGGAFSAGGGAAGSAGESGGREKDAGPTRLTEEDAAGPTRSSGDDGSLAAGAGEGTPSSGAADSGASAASIEDACFPPDPVLEAKPSRGAPGDGFGIRGENFDGNLRDCDGDPARDVRVEFLQDGRKWELGRLVSDKNSRLAAKLEVPADAGPGRATVRATYGQGPPEDPHGRTSAEARFLVTE